MLPDFCVLRKFFSTAELVEMASVILDFQRVKSFTLRASKPSVTSPCWREKPTLSSSFLRLLPRLRAFRNKGCKHARVSPWTGQVWSYLSVYLEVEAVMFVKGELVTIEGGVGGRQEDKIIEEKAEQFLLRFSFLENSTVEKPPRTDRVGQRVESYLLLQGFLLRLEVNMDL